MVSLSQPLTRDPYTYNIYFLNIYDLLVDYHSHKQHHQISNNKNSFTSKKLNLFTKKKNVNKVLFFHCLLEFSFHSQKVLKLFEIDYVFIYGVVKLLFVINISNFV